MTIHNFYLVALGIIWVAILLVLYTRVLAARFCCFFRRRAKSRISLVFSPNCSPKKCARICRSLPRYARNEQLFRHICECYSSMAETSPQACPGALTLCMKELLHSRITHLPPNNPIQRRLLIQYVESTHLSTDEIDRFLEQSSGCPGLSPAVFSSLNAIR